MPAAATATSAARRIDGTTTVGLSMLVVMIGGAWHLSSAAADLKNGVDRLNVQMEEVKTAIDRNTAQLASDGKALSALQAVVGSLQERVRKLEDK